jgi:hypothetical protein
VPVTVASEDPEADMSVLDALKSVQAREHEPTVTEIRQQIAMEAEDPEPAVIAARERAQELDHRIAESIKNPLERVGESIEKGRTAHAFEHLGEEIAHGHIAGAAESIGRTIKDASVAVEHRMEEVAEKGLAAAEHLKDRAKALLHEPHLHRHEKGDYAHPPVFVTEERLLHETMADRALRSGSEPVPPVPAWLHETHHVPKIERDYPAPLEVVPAKVLIIEPVVEPQPQPTNKISDEEILLGPL